MNIAFYTLGCKVNQYETQALGSLLEKKGHKIIQDTDAADIIVINTCTVTSSSDQKSRRAIRHFIKANPDAKIAVCGCLSQVNAKSIEEIDGVSVIAGTFDRELFASAIDALANGENIHLQIDNALSRREFENLPAGGLLGHTRALLKIEDGCSNFCTYCIIPYSRGPVRSMSPDEAIRQCEKLHRENYKEIVLTGIEISSYGRDLTPKTDLAELICTLCEKFPDIRFRLGSLEPRTVTEEFCVKLKSFTNLCHHFHLSMQSGCDATLLRMKRKYDTSRFFESVTMLKNHFNGAAITTDMIVGFPGEDENEFKTSLDFIERCAFSSMHIFPYSMRCGTPAAKMKNQVTKSEKARRAKEAGELANKMEKAFLLSRINETESVLFEELSDGYWTGHSKNYSKMYLRTDADLKNAVADVTVTGLFRDGLLCEIK